MSGYVKMWTTLRNNEAFLSQNCTARGVYMQLILAAKEQRDDGTVCYRSIHAMSTDCALDKRTCDKVLTNLSQNSLCTFVKSDSGVITITLPNYKHWQEIDIKEVLSKQRKNVTKIPPLRADQTRADQTRPKDNIPFEEIIGHLNQLTGKNFNPKTERTKQFISGRWHEGFRLDDFKYVHYVKVAEWLGDVKWECFLRPKTLYSPANFESYRNQRPKAEFDQMSERQKKNTIACVEWLKQQGIDYGSKRQDGVRPASEEIIRSLPATDNG